VRITATVIATMPSIASFMLRDIGGCGAGLALSSVKARPLNAVGELVEFVGDMLKELAALNAVHFFGRAPKQYRPLPVILRTG
jgi:hypothetical protein